MLVIYFLFIYLFFFWLQCVKQEYTLFVSSENQTLCILFLQIDYF